CSVRCFFFSSRRRHTILVSDWSSDVCSSDLALGLQLAERMPPLHAYMLAMHSRALAASGETARAIESGKRAGELLAALGGVDARSEERRVGKEGRCRGWACQGKRKRGRCRGD